ncbi:hypothetical protein JL720_5760 [Aureococcus anophagefferens]|nr:hypothetical protein JL720_5760 [Aureococcus anophagefferens]
MDVRGARARRARKAWGSGARDSGPHAKRVADFVAAALHVDDDDDDDEEEEEEGEGDDGDDDDDDDDDDENTEASKTTPTTVATFQPEAFLAIDQFITLETPLSNVTPRSP